MQNNPINGETGINDPTLPSNIDADQEDKNVKQENHSEEVVVPEDFDKFNVDKVKELEESKDPSNKDA